MRFDEILGLVPRLSFGLEGGAGSKLFGLEMLFWVLVVLLTLTLIRFRPAFVDRAEARIRRISQFQRFWLVSFCLWIVVVRVALLPLVPIPIPSIHDESSYILAADTFSHGRLTNPTNPMWQHFESFHINMQPTYQSMYPPAQGLALASGQLLTGNPWFGVLFSTALMCSAIYWMLLGWLPAPWAWLGGALACVRFGIFSYWLNSYFGGSVAAIGGALVLGSLPRVREKPTARIGLILAAGLLILANSRPLEGFLFSVPILISVVLILIKSEKLAWQDTIKAMLPAVIFLVAGGAWMLYYNWRGTGNPLLMPYVINFKTYHITKPYFFQASNPVPQYHHLSMRRVYVFHEFPNLLISKYDLSGLIFKRLSIYYTFFFWPFLLLIGPCLLAVWRSRLRVLLFSLAILAANLLAQVWDPLPHYAAPATGAVLLLLLFSLRHFRNSKSEYALWASRAIVLAFALWMISPIAEKLRDPYMIDPIVTKPDLTGTKVLVIKAHQLPPEFEHDRIEALLRERTGKHLVIVHYSQYDVPDDEWVYNEADLDHAHIIWARDMGEQKNKELLNYYADRQSWYVDHGALIAQILPYDQALAQLRLASEVPPAEIAFPAVANALKNLSYQAAVVPLPTRPQYSAAVSR